MTCSETHWWKRWKHTNDLFCGVYLSTKSNVMSFWLPIVVTSCAIYQSNTCVWLVLISKLARIATFHKQLRVLNTSGTTSRLEISYVKSTWGWWLLKKKRIKSCFKVLILLSTICNGITFACHRHLQIIHATCYLHLPKGPCNACEIGVNNYMNVCLNEARLS